MLDPNLLLLQDAAGKLAPFLNEIVFVGGVTLGLLITDRDDYSLYLNLMWRSGVGHRHGSRDYIDPGKWAYSS